MTALADEFLEQFSSLVQSSFIDGETAFRMQTVNMAAEHFLKSCMPTNSSVHLICSDDAESDCQGDA